MRPLTLRSLLTPFRLLAGGLCLADAGAFSQTLYRLAGQRLGLLDAGGGTFAQLDAVALR